MSLYTYPHISPQIRASLEAYHYLHRPTGGFLEAVIRNDLIRAIVRADSGNADYDVLKDLVWYVHNELPSIALDFTRWTTCVCENRGGANCYVHTYTEALLRSWEVA